MSEQNTEKSISKPARNVPTEIPVGANKSMDISWLPENEREALLKQYMDGVLDIARKAVEYEVDSAVLEKTLGDLSDAAREISDAGNAVTIKHTRKTAGGETRIIIGNTEEAKRGKISKSQAGEKDWTPYYIFGGILALIIMVVLANN